MLDQSEVSMARVKKYWIETMLKGSTSPEALQDVLETAERRMLESEECACWASSCDPESWALTVKYLEGIARNGVY